MTDGIENWNDIRHFLAVAQHGSLAAAARKLAVNQSTVLRRIAALEESLGARLFDKNPRGYVLNHVGEEFLALASKVEDSIMALNRAIQGADMQLHGVIRITTVDEVLERIAPHIRCFCEQYPLVELDVSTDSRVYSLAKREADVAIRPGPQPHEADVIARALAKLQSAAYASLSYLERHPRPREKKDLANHRIIDFSLESRRRVVARWLEEDSITSQTAYLSNSLRGVQVATRAGIGVSLLPCFMGDSDDELVKLFPSSWSSEYQLWLLYHSDLRQTARVRAFIDHLSTELAKEQDLYAGKTK